jgi:hypothetical protein
LNTVKVSWNGAPRRVTAPFIIEFLTPMVCSGRVAFFGIRAQTGGKFHLKLNMTARLIVNKYREGKVKRTLKRELKVLEIVKGEANVAVEFVMERTASRMFRRRFRFIAGSSNWDLAGNVPVMWQSFGSRCTLTYSQVLVECGDLS